MKNRNHCSRGCKQVVKEAKTLEYDIPDLNMTGLDNIRTQEK